MHRLDACESLLGQLEILVHEQREAIRRGHREELAQVTETMAEHWTRLRVLIELGPISDEASKKKLRTIIEKLQLQVQSNAGLIERALFHIEEMKQSLSGGTQQYASSGLYVRAGNARSTLRVQG